MRLPSTTFSYFCPPQKLSPRFANATHTSQHHSALLQSAGGGGLGGSISGKVSEIPDFCGG